MVGDNECMQYTALEQKREVCSFLLYLLVRGKWMDENTPGPSAGFLFDVGEEGKRGGKWK